MRKNSGLIARHSVLVVALCACSLLCAFRPRRSRQKLWPILTHSRNANRRRAKGDGLEEIGRDVAVDLLKRGDSKLWLHFDSPTQEDLQFLRKHPHPRSHVEHIVHQNQHAKLDSFDDYVYLAVHQI
jgi:Mg2+ and Co2+ transporter CorA